MARHHEVKIGETIFRITRFDPFTALALFGDLQRDVLPAVGGLLAAVFAGGPGQEASERDERAAIEAFRELSQQLGGQKLTAWADRLIDEDLVSFEIPGREPAKLSKANRGMAFQDFADILELLFHIVRFNFADPLVRWAGHIGPVRELLAKRSGDSAPTSKPN